MEKSLKSIATNYGMYLGVALVLITILAYAIDLSLFVNTWFGISIYVIIIIFGIYAVAKVKQAFNSFATFKDAFSAYFITILVGLLISATVTFILFNFIDTDAALVLKEKSVEKIIQVYEKMNLAPDKIAEIVDKIESENLYSIKNSLVGLTTSYLLPLSIIGLIVAAAMKKSDPNAE
ncbi:MAG: DUF4199 domain-containing protein [Algibacter sp.]